MNEIWSWADELPAASWLISAVASEASGDGSEPVSTHSMSKRAMRPSSRTSWLVQLRILTFSSPR